MIGELTIALLTLDFRASLGKVLVRLWATCCTKSHTTSGNMMGLGGRIAYNLEQDLI